VSGYRRIHMEARDSTRNRFRRWELEVAEDLFGAWIVRVNFGRIGSTGRTFARSFTDRVTAARYVRAAVARRHSAPRRIGVAYRVIADDGTLA
jgi:predicted DNA-binding WGR domain protein